MDLAPVSQGRNNLLISGFVIKPFLRFPELFGQLGVTVPPRAAHDPGEGRRKQNQDLPTTSERW